MSNNVSAEITVEWNGGAHGYGNGRGPRGTLVLDGGVAFRGRFCSLHPDTQIEGEGEGGDQVYVGGGGSASAYYCPKCREGARKHLERVLPEIRINCGIIDHEHECRCWFGHDCKKDPCYVQNELKRGAIDENGNPVEPNAMEVLGAEAPNQAMLSMSQRLARLEKENEVLTSAVRRLMGLLPEDAREAFGCTEVLLGSQGPASD